MSRLLRKIGKEEKDTSSKKHMKTNGSRKCLVDLKSRHQKWLRTHKNIERGGA
jgi:hypothetical protein